MEVDIIVALAIGAVAITFLVQGARILRTASLHKTLRRAVELGQPVTAELIDKLERPTVPGGQDQRIAFILIALALAAVLAAMIGGASTEDLRVTIGAAMFPLLVGGAMLIRLRMNRASDPE